MEAGKATSTAEVNFHEEIPTGADMRARTLLANFLEHRKRGFTLVPGYSFFLDHYSQSQDFLFILFCL